jgi:bifunctional enzyme CysN/CysC
MATCEQVRLVLVGHVDHGKSTLIGRLLHDTGALPEGKYEQLVKVAERRGVAFEWANLMDALQAERDQNVTIDTAQIWFRRGDREYVIIDAPGHKEFVKNMVTGASLADAATIVVDAQEGVREQSRRHGMLLKLIGVSQVVVVVNKMDLVGYSARAFEAVEAELSTFLQSIGLSPKAIVPVSARHGENLASRGASLSWFEGPTLLEALDRLSPRPRPVDAAFRMAVQDVYRFDHRRIVVGRVDSGTVRPGDEIVFMPGRKRSRVHAIERWNGGPPSQATAGESIGLTLDEQLFVERGAIAAAPADVPLVSAAFRARVFWLGRKPLAVGSPYRLKLATQEVDCDIQAIDRVVDGASLEEVAADHVTRDQLADVTIRTKRPIVADRYEAVPALGRFVIVDGFDLAGGGVIVEGIRKAAAADAAAPLVRSVGHVTRDDREKRNRHRGAVVWLTGLSASGKSTLASSLESDLFERGLQVFVLDGDNVRLGLNADLGFSAEDRAENIRRVAQVAKLFAEAGAIAITAFISPYRVDRQRARQIMKEGGEEVPFLEVFVHAPLEVCEQRDPKGMYKKAREGKIKQFTGVSDPYEPPEHPELLVNTADRTVEECVAQLRERVLSVVMPERK